MVIGHHLNTISTKQEPSYIKRATHKNNNHKFSILIKDGIHCPNSATMTWTNIKPKMRLVLQIAELNVFGWEKKLTFQLQTGISYCPDFCWGTNQDKIVNNKKKQVMAVQQFSIISLIFLFYISILISGLFNINPGPPCSSRVYILPQ